MFSFSCLFCSASIPASAGAQPFLENDSGPAGARALILRGTAGRWFGRWLRGL